MNKEDCRKEASHSANICQLCDVNVSKYCCPRCDLFYCSLACYKSEKHLTCSERFYKDCIKQEINVSDPNPFFKNKMLEILSRNYRNNTNSPNNLENILNNDSDDESEDISSDSEDAHDSDDEDSLADLAERMRDINLDDAEKVWEALSQNEKREFQELIKSEDVSKILSIWDPWWLYHKEGVEIQEVVDNVKKDHLVNSPPIFKNIEKFSSISSRSPAPCVKFNLYNILASYVYVVRLFNGEHHFFDREAVCCLHSICKNLNGNVNYEDALSAVLSVVHECYNNSAIITDTETKKFIFNDLQSLLRGPNNLDKNYYILSALSDLHSLVTKSKIKYNKAETNKCNKLVALGDFAQKFTEHDMLELPQPSKPEIMAYLKKIEYFLSYTNAFSSDVTSSVFVVL